MADKEGSPPTNLHKETEKVQHDRTHGDVEGSKGLVGETPILTQDQIAQKRYEIAMDAAFTHGNWGLGMAALNLRLAELRVKLLEEKKQPSRWSRLWSRWKQS